jgi:hypothetical protein
VHMMPGRLCRCNRYKRDVHRQRSMGLYLRALNPPFSDPAHPRPDRTYLSSITFKHSVKSFQ